MSNLYLNLTQMGRANSTLCLSAENAIETTLVVMPDRASLPTLVSVENVIGYLNNAGYALIDEGEAHKIAALVHNYYIPTPYNTWRDQVLGLTVNPVALEDRPMYAEIDNIRSTLVQAARDVARYEGQDDYSRSKAVQDQAIVRVVASVKAKPEWWKKIPGFLAKTLIPIIFDKLIGIPLGTIVKSALGNFFEPQYL